MKMYILVLNDVPDEFVPVICSHAALMCYLEFKDTLNNKQWMETSFKKAVCSVFMKELNKAREAGDYVEVTESALGGRLVALAFDPRPEWPNVFKYAKLWKPKKDMYVYVRSNGD